ncbi:MAG TPA: transcriptional regulator [Acidimicrobiia bacterium]
MALLAGEQFAVLDPGPFGGWSLTDSGRSVDDEALGKQLDALGSRHPIHDCYQRFLGLNPTLLEICSDWQMLTVGNAPILNDHTDADYDARVLSRLIRVDTSAQDLLTEMASLLDRFGIYRRRLSAALEQAIAGSHSHVADSLDSYHMVWFQLHEDLLTTLGISRHEERERSP